jgi:CRISPR-associated endonuclease/helicase Cas3
MRSLQERHLDQVLKRKEKFGEPPKSLSNPVIRQHLDGINKNIADTKNVLFILVATPVEEVGRDHDFDWAVIEPSSYRSIVQLAGRVKRHREGEVESPNISVLQYNWKGVRDYHHEDAKVFNRPGFEELLRLKSHDMNDLIDVEAVRQRLDAVARIQKPEHLTANCIRKLTKVESLTELEHAATWHCLSNYKREGLGRQVGPDTLQGYLNESWFLTALPQVLTPFRKSEPSIKVFLVFDEYQQESKFCEKDEQGHAIDREQILNIQRIELSKKVKSRLWLTRNFDGSCEKMAGEQDLSQRIISLRYGELSFSHNEKKQYVYNDQLGLVKV